MNQIAWQIFGGTKAKANTFIGGVASTITTSGALATKLGIASNRITNFKIVGSDIECRISGNILPGIWTGDNSLTYYKSEAVTDLGSNTWVQNCDNLTLLEFKNVIIHTGGAIARDCDKEIVVLLENCQRLSSNAFWESEFSGKKTIYIPRVTQLGSVTTIENVFTSLVSGTRIYCNPILQTSNSGGVEGDLAYAISRGAIVRYVTNFTAPNSITNLSVGTIYGTAIQLNFTAPTGITNAIDYYEVWQNGVNTGKRITASGQYVTGLTLNTAYTFQLIPVDIFYNKSTSNMVSATTVNLSYTDADANAYISAATLISSEQESAYQLITDLKTAGLWTKIQAIYPFKGTTAAQHKFNAKNPLDTNAAFRLVFGGTGTYSNLGFQCNGTNSYANTFFAPNPNQNVNSNGLTLVVGTNNTNIVTDPCDVAVYQSETQISLVTSKGSNTTFYKESMLNSRASSVKSLGVNDAKGILTGSRLSGLNKLFKNGSLLGSATASGILPTNNFYIGALNYLNNPSNYTNQRIQMVAFHEGLSDAEVATLHSIIDLSEAIAGRKTW